MLSVANNGGLLLQLYEYCMCALKSLYLFELIEIHIYITVLIQYGSFCQIHVYDIVYFTYKINIIHLLQIYKILTTIL